MKKFTKVLSLLVATAIAVSTFTITSSAADTAAVTAQADAHRRALTQDEILILYNMFDSEAYYKMYPDVKQALGTDKQALFAHFVAYGVWERRLPSTTFDVDVYASMNYDLQKAFGDDIISYYVYFWNHYAEQKYMPTKYAAYWANRDVYSVYDYVKGQMGPKAGSYLVQNRFYHPDIVVPEN